MNPGKYAKLLKNSEVFRLLDEETQALMLKATGKTKNAFSEIFTTIGEIEQRHKLEFINTANNFYSSFVHKLEQKSRNARQVAEKNSQFKDENSGENLLKQINS